MKLDRRFTETIDRLIRNIPAARTILLEEGHTNLAGQLGRDLDNLIYQREHLGNPQETVACIPSSVIETIHATLLKTLDVEVPWSDDPLEMAHAAIERQKTGISQVMALIIEHCFYLPAEQEEPAP